MRFAVGDVVRLNSGGPALTVAALTEKGYICHWFDHAGHCEDASFVEGTLTPFPTPKFGQRIPLRIEDDLGKPEVIG
jgi:uncharacterized protein YodC (DUF2158 family)